MVTHAVTRHHRTGDLGCLFDIIRSPCRDRMEDQLLRRTAAGQCHDLVERLFPAHQEALIRLHLHRISECPGGSRHNRDLVDRSRVTLAGCDEGMSDLMVGYDTSLIFGNSRILSLIACDDGLHAFLHIFLADHLAVHADGTKGCLINDIGKLCSACTGCRPGDRIKVYRFIHADIAGMYL